MNFLRIITPEYNRQLFLNYFHRNKNLIVLFITFFLSSTFSFYVWPITIKYFYIISTYQKFFNLFNRHPVRYTLISLSILLLAYFLPYKLISEKIHTLLKKVKSFHWIILYLIVYTSIFTSLAYFKHINLGTAIFDLGVEEQVLYTTARGDFLGSGVEDPNYLAIHFAPMLIVPALIYRIFPSVLTLFIIQGLAVAFSAYAIFLIAKKILENTKLAFVIMVVFTLHWGVSSPLVFDFHEAVLAMPFLAWGIYFFISDEKNKFRSYIMFIFASLFKEDVNLFITSLALYWVFFEKKKKAIPILFFGVAMSILTFFVIIPKARGGAPSRLIDRYSDWGNSPKEIVKNILRHPLRVLRYSTSEVKKSYLFKQFLPVGFIFIFAPFALLIFFPTLMLNLLNRSDLGVTGTSHYEAIFVIGLFYASILGLKNFLDIINRYFYKREVIAVYSFFTLLISFMLLLGHPLWSIFNMPKRTADYSYIQNLKSRIPKDATIAASNLVGGQFGDRPRNKLQIFEPTWVAYKELPDYIIADKKFNYTPEVQNRITAYQVERKYYILEENDSFIVLKK